MRSCVGHKSSLKNIRELPNTQQNISELLGKVNLILQFNIVETRSKRNKWLLYPQFEENLRSFSQLVCKQ